MQLSKRLFIRLMFLAAVACLQPVMLFAQTATITGAVTDATGAVIPAAKVTARNQETNVVRTAEAGEAGVYRIPNLTPGKYEVTFENAGFQVMKYSDLELTVGQTLTLDAKLALSGVTTVVEVSGEQVVPIELETAQLSNLVDQRRITELPLLTRDPYELVLLSPGVVQTNAIGGFAVNGSGERRNNFLLDGADNNDTSVPGIPSGASALNPDATREFRVVTNAFQAEYGRNTGAIIDIVTKGGTNELHGTAYWFGRYDATAARDFFNPTDESEPFVRNQFGGSVGGPIFKDKTFWFGNYDGSRFRTTRIIQSVVPTAAFRTGVFTFQGQNVDLSNPASGNNPLGLSLDPTVQQILALYPTPNGAAVDDIRGFLNFPSTSQFDADNFTVKIDHTFNQNHTLTGRYTFNQFQDPNAFNAEVLPGIGGISTEGRTQGLSLAYTTILTPNLLNEARWNGNRIRAQFDCTGVGDINAVTGGRDFNFIGLSAFACGALGNSDGQARFTGTYVIRDTLSWNRGKHAFRFGGEYRWVYENGFSGFFTREAVDFDVRASLGLASVDLDPSTACDPFNPTPTTCEGSNRFNELAATLFGLVNSQSQTQFFDSAGNRRATDLTGFRQREFAFFAQDTWKLASNFTLNLGLRYEFYGVPFEVNDNLSQLFADPSGFAPFTFDIVGPGTARQLYENDLNNFMPRIGFSWDPFGKGKTSVRASYGIFYDRVFGNLISNTSGNPPFASQPFFFQFDVLSNLSPIPTTPASAVVNDLDFLSPSLFERNLRNPYSQNWNFGIQHEVLTNVLVEVNYVGSKGTKLLRVVDGNPPQQNLIDALLAAGVPASDLQFNTLRFGAEIGVLPFNAVNNNAFGPVFVNTTQATSTYNAIQANVTKRFSGGFQIQGAYTWSHAIDWASDPLAPTAANRQLPRGRDAKASELGNSDFDVRQRLVVNYLYELPWGRGRRWLSSGVFGRLLEGWQVSGITTFSDGTPYDIFCTVDSDHSSRANRCDLLAVPDPANDPSVPGAPRTQTGPPRRNFDDPALFGRNGTLQRNVFTQPGIANWDLLISKHTQITERWKLEFRTEIFNAFNRVQFGAPGQLFADPGTFGQSTSQVGRQDGTSGARQFQFALKLHF